MKKETHVPFQVENESIQKSRSHSKRFFLGRDFLLPSTFFLLTCLFSGCIRLSAKTGYWSKGANDEYAKSHTVGFDTADYVPGSPPPGDIQMEDK